MYLLFNVYTFLRDNHERFNRFDVFKYVLKSYSRIDFKKVFLFVRFDAHFAQRSQEFADHTYSLFGREKVEIVWDRYETQEEWYPFMSKLCSENDPNELVWFFSNDDHVFIDFDLEHLNEGLELMKKDPSPFKTMYTSHWPEMLKYCGKYGKQTREGNYIKTKFTILDSFQIMNIGYLKFLFLQLCWEGSRNKRIDSIVGQRESVGTDPSRPCIGDRVRNDSYHLYLINDLQTIYVPMRELCRHFDAYSHVKIPTDRSSLFPALVLPEEENNFTYTRELIIQRARCPHNSAWTKDNSFEIPDEWVENILKLYKC